jgi:3',5'-cyclic-AMP phosphodiesterase
LSEPVTFIHLSDLHIAPPSERAYGTDTAGNLRAVAQRIREMDLAPACFIFSGDLCDRGDRASYTHLRDILRDEFEPFGAPLLLGLGNHDGRLPFRQVILGQTDADDEQEPYFYSHSLGDLRVLMLDSKVPGAVHGLLGEAQLAWLDERLAEPSDGDLIVMHHPSVPRGVPRPDDYLLLDADALSGVLGRHPRNNVLAILCGHSHVSTSSIFAGTLHVAAPATAYLLDPSIRDGDRGLEGAAFNLCTVRDGRLIVNPVFLPSTSRELFRHRPAASATLVAASRPG